MFVITADQVASRRDADRVDDALGRLTERYRSRMPLPPERTAGDELQAVTDDPGTALSIVLDLARDGHWSVGLGVGPVAEPLGATTRASTGAAFIAARAAVEAARRSPEPRFALRSDDRETSPADDLEPLIGMLLLLRSRRTAAGWTVADLLGDGHSQSDAADALGITPQAVSQRALAAGLRVEQGAVPSLVRLLGEADRAVSQGAGRIGA